MEVAELERWIRRDPARRGLLASQHSTTSLCAGHLDHAARSLARESRSVAIVTGFFVPDAVPPSAETDGPLGALLIADVVQSAGGEACLITDTPCASALQAALNAADMTATPLLVCPVDREQSMAWRSDFWSSPRGEQLTHLISVERIGACREAGEIAVTDHCPENNPPRYFNMRGMSIDEWSSDLDELFIATPVTKRGVDATARQVVTIGIGDGGNEIGMGTVSREELAKCRTPELALRHLCHVPTEWMIVAGTSDWGAFALAAATLLAQDRLAHLEHWPPARMESILKAMVEHGPAVDGCTRTSQATVDGLPLITYLQPWMSIRRACGWHD